MQCCLGKGGLETTPGVSVSGSTSTECRKAHLCQPQHGSPSSKGLFSLSPPCAFSLFLSNAPSPLPVLHCVVILFGNASYFPASCCLSLSFLCEPQLSLRRKDVTNGPTPGSSCASRYPCTLWRLFLSFLKWEWLEFSKVVDPRASRWVGIFLDPLSLSKTFHLLESSLRP